jgi:hypothetical protein
MDDEVEWVGASVRQAPFDEPCSGLVEPSGSAGQGSEFQSIRINSKDSRYTFDLGPLYPL